MAETPLSNKLIRESFRVARKNWADWRDVFEHDGHLATNPLLATPERFAVFCDEYSVGRTIRKGTQNSFRRALAGPRFSKCIQSDSCMLDRYEAAVRSRFGTHEGTRSMISVLSKVAAFVRPERYIAWDRYARRGLNLTLGRGPNAPFETYAQYLADFDQVWNGALGQQIRDSANADGSEIEKSPHFQRRVLDVVLMKSGGRWSKKANKSTR